MECTIRDAYVITNDTNLMVPAEFWLSIQYYNGFTKYHELYDIVEKLDVWHSDSFVCVRVGRRGR